MTHDADNMVRAECDCGTPHMVERGLVGMHDWWKCNPCLDAAHRDFVKWHAAMVAATSQSEPGSGNA